MRRVGRIAMVALVALLTCAVAGTEGAEGGRHSGTVVAVAKDRGTIVIGEVGPWRVKDGQTEVVKRTFAVTTSTQFVRLTKRAEAAPGGWPGDLVETPLGAWEVTAGEFVTVEIEPAAKRPTARKITVVSPGGS